jgi:hypothetical protein
MPTHPAGWAWGAASRRFSLAFTPAWCPQATGVGAPARVSRGVRVEHRAGVEASEAQGPLAEDPEIGGKLTFPDYANFFRFVWY